MEDYIKQVFVRLCKLYKVFKPVILLTTWRDWKPCLTHICSFIFVQSTIISKKFTSPYVVITLHTDKMPIF